MYPLKSPPGIRAYLKAPVRFSRIWKDRFTLKVPPKAEEDTANCPSGKFFAEGKSIIEFVFLFIQGLLVAIIKYKIWIFVLFSFYFVKKENVLKINEKLLLKFLQINLVLFFSLILAIYFNLFVNSEIDFSWWIYTSLDRLLYSISGIFIIYIVFFKDFLSRYISK